MSVVVLTKNEAANIAECLDSLKAFAEVFVVDSESEDGTVETAQSLGATVVDFKWNGRYPKKKQWALENIPFSTDWVLYVDADERVTPALAEEIRNAVADTGKVGYFVTYRYWFDGRFLEHGHRVFKLVLFRRERGAFEARDDLAASNMWEVEGHYQPNVEGGTGVLASPMLHRDYDSLFDYFERHNRYSDWEAVLRTSPPRLTGAEVGSRRVLKTLFARLPARGLLAFLHSYIFRLGFLDGRPGLNYAIARGAYYWQIDLKLREMRRSTDQAERTHIT